MDDIFPYIEVSGSYEGVGHAIGKRTGPIVRKIVKQQRQNIPNYLTHLERSKKYYSYTKKIFPHLINELNSIAMGAKVNVYEYFFINNSEVADSFKERCTTAVSFNSTGAIIGHNEDSNINTLPQLYILKATVNDTTFFGINYAGEVPGVAASMNNHGLVQCINSLHPTTTQFGVPKNFIARAILECKSIEEAAELIRKVKHASGYNHVLVQGKKVVNVEIACDHIAHEIKKEASYIHTNHYLIPEMLQYEKSRSESSLHRYKRAHELVKRNMTYQHMVDLLSDTSDSNYPICRAKDTIASLIFQPQLKKIEICKGHPCAGQYKEYSL